jgi:hypothetical protein
VQKINNRGPIAAIQRANRLANRLAKEAAPDNNLSESSGDIDEEPANQVLDHQLLDPRLFDLDQPVGQLLDRQLGLDGPVLPQIGLMVADEPVNPPVNPPLDVLTGQPVRRRKRTRVAIEAEDEPVVVNPPVNPPIGVLAGRPVRRRKRTRVAIEAENEPVVQPKRKRQKRTA